MTVLHETPPDAIAHYLILAFNAQGNPLSLHPDDLWDGTSAAYTTDVRETYSFTASRRSAFRYDDAERRWYRNRIAYYEVYPPHSRHRNHVETITR